MNASRIARLIIINVLSLAVSTLSFAAPSIGEDTIAATAKVDPDLASPFFQKKGTAACVSTHQGTHTMDECEAFITANGIETRIFGGMPAYASSLSLTIDSKLSYQCSFKAVYPAPTNRLRWKITQKDLKLKRSELKSGTRLYGWISVTFDEVDTVTGASTNYKIEGYFKPVIQRQALGQ